MTNQFITKYPLSLISVTFPILLLVLSASAFAQEKSEAPSSQPGAENSKISADLENDVSVETSHTSIEATSSEQIVSTKQTTENKSLSREISAEEIEFQHSTDRCLAAPGSREMQALLDKKKACEEVVASIKSEERTSGTLSNEKKLNRTAVEQELNRINELLPDNPITENQSWSLTVPVFTGLIRVQLGNTKDGTADQFLPFTGVGSGVKLRHCWLDRKGQPIETLGISFFSYFEPAVKTTNPDKTAQTVSLGILFTTVQYFGLGLGYKFVSNEPEYERWTSNNIMFLLGIGVDGNTLTP